MSSTESVPVLPADADSTVYENWKRDILIWLVGTSKSLKQVGPTVYGTLSGRAKDQCRSLDLAILSNGNNHEVLKIPNSIAAIFDKLDVLYVRSSALVHFRKFVGLFNTKRSVSESVIDFVSSFDKTVCELASTKLKLDTNVSSLLLINNCQLSGLEESLLFSMLLREKELHEIEYEEAVRALRYCFGHSDSSTHDHEHNFVAPMWKKGGKGHGKGKRPGFSSYGQSSGFPKSKGKGGKFQSPSSSFPVRSSSAVVKGQSGKGSFTGKCHRCGKFGHMARDCQTVLQVSESHVSGENVGTVSQTICIEPECDGFDSVESTVNCIFNVSSLPVLDIHHAIIDTACTSTVASREWFFKYIDYAEENGIDVPYYQSKRRFVFGNGASIKSLYMVKIPLYIGKHRISVLVDILPCRKTPLLLSNDALRKLGAIIDFGRDELSFPSFGLHAYKMGRNSAKNFVIPLNILVDEKCNLVAVSQNSPVKSGNSPPGSETPERRSVMCCTIQADASETESERRVCAVGRASESVSEQAQSVPGKSVPLVSKSSASTSAEGSQVVIPESKRSRLDLSAKDVRRLHENCNHMSSNKMWLLLRYSANVNRKVIDEVVDNCPVCATYVKKAKKPVVGGLISSRFNQLVAMDLIDLRFMGHQILIMNMVDIYSRFVHAEIISDKSAESTLAVILGYCRIAGRPPSCLFADNGSEFSNTVVKEWCSRNDVEFFTTSPYSPWSNGITERKNAYLEQVFVKAAHEWEHIYPIKKYPHVILSETVRCLNTVPRDCGLSPFTIAFGLPATPNLFKDNPSPAELSPPDHISSFTSRRLLNERIHDYVMSHECYKKVNEAISRRKRDSDEPFDLHERVYLRHDPDSQASIGYLSGPYVVVGISGRTYRIKQGAQEVAVSGHRLRRKNVTFQESDKPRQAKAKPEPKPKTVVSRKHGNDQSVSVSSEIPVPPRSVPHAKPVPNVSFGDSRMSDESPLAVRARMLHAAGSSVRSKSTPVASRIRDESMLSPPNESLIGTSPIRPSESDYDMLDAPLAIENDPMFGFIYRDQPALPSASSTRGRSTSPSPSSQFVPPSRVSATTSHFDIATPVQHRPARTMSREPSRTPAVNVDTQPATSSQPSPGKRVSKYTVCGDCLEKVEFGFPEHDEFCHARKRYKFSDTESDSQDEENSIHYTAFQISNNVPASSSDVDQFQADFDQAKLKELSNWVKHDVYSLVEYSESLKDKNIISTRWVNTWKRGDSGSVPKSRLVVRGFEDSQGELLETDSPTLSKLCFHLLLQFSVDNDYVLQSIDLKTAFLQSSPFVKES